MGVLVGLGNTLLIAAVSGAAMVLSSCGPTTGGADVLPVQASIVNRTGKVLSRVEYRPCGGAEAWAPLGIGAIGAGANMSFQLPAPCVDMNAYYSDGKVAGSQRGIRRDFPFTWTLS